MMYKLLIRHKQVGINTCFSSRNNILMFIIKKSNLIRLNAKFSIYIFIKGTIRLHIAYFIRQKNLLKNVIDSQTTIICCVWWYVIRACYEFKAFFITGQNIHEFIVNR